MEKQPACAAPISSSGFVPGPSSIRLLNEYDPSKAPLPSRIVPDPSCSERCPTASPGGTGILGEAVAADEVVVEIFRSRPHAADVERHPGLERLARASTVIINADRYVRGDGERIEGAAGDLGARLEIGTEEIHVARTEERGDPSVGELTGQAQSAGGERREIDGHRLANRPRQELETLVEMEDLTLEDQAIAPKHLADDGDRFSHAEQGLVERHPVPAAHHLVATRPEPEDEAAAGDQIERGRRLREEGRRLAEHIYDPGAEPDALGAGGQGAEDGD